MFLSWDLEGRTACETCIRDALTKNGFRCPLTGQEGISPDDLHPNLAIRRAADEFVKGVMDKIEEIEKQGALEEAEQPEDQNEAANAKSKQKTNLLDGDTGGEKGVVVTKRGALANKRKAKEEDDPFAGDDEFGGDVFAIAAEAKPPVEEENSGTKTAPAKPEAPKPAVVEEKENKKAPEAKKDDDSPVPVAGTAPTSGNAPKEGDPARNDTSSPSNRKSVNEDSANKDAPQGGGHSSAYDRKGPPPPPPPPPPKNDSNRHQRPHYRRDNTTRQRRGPPAGYQMGPAGGATGPVASHDTGRSIDRNDRNDDDRSQDSRGFGRGGGRGGGRSPHGRFNADRGGFRGGRGRGRFNGGRFNGQDQRGRGDHYGGGRGQPRNTHSLSPENVSTCSLARSFVVVAVVVVRLLVALVVESDCVCISCNGEMMHSSFRWRPFEKF